MRRPRAAEKVVSIPQGKARMSNVWLRDEELRTDISLSCWLLPTQFPEWANLPIEPIRSAGTDHSIFRLGDDMAVRLSRVKDAIGQAEKEREWLLQFVGRLPLAIPVPLALGMPDERYPWTQGIFMLAKGE